MKIFVAGANTKGGEAKLGKPGTQEICKDYGVPKLYSFLNEKGLIETWDDNYTLMVDSGAHSWNKETITKIGMAGKKSIPPAKEFIRTYFEFIKLHAHRPLIFVEFDVYGHLSMEAVDLLWKRVMELSGKCKYMRVYHPMCDGGSLDTIRKWMDEGAEYIGVGNDSTEILGKIFHLTRDKIKVHGFAMTKLPLMEKYPFFSVDSTSPLSTVIFGYYSAPLMAKYTRDDIAEMKSPLCFDGGWERMRKAIEEVARTQEYVTNLWTLKGITWPELKY